MDLEVRSAPPSSGYIGQYYKRRPPKKPLPLYPAMIAVVATGFVIGLVVLRPAVEAWMTV